MTSNNIIGAVGCFVCAAMIIATQDATLGPAGWFLAGLAFLDR